MYDRPVNPTKEATLSNPFAPEPVKPGPHCPKCDAPFIGQFALRKHLDKGRCDIHTDSTAPKESK